MALSAFCDGREEESRFVYKRTHKFLLNLVWNLTAQTLGKSMPSEQGAAPGRQNTKLVCSLL